MYFLIKKIHIIKDYFEKIEKANNWFFKKNNKSSMINDEQIHDIRSSCNPTFSPSK